MEKEKFLERLTEEDRKLDDKQKAAEDPFAKTVDFSCALCGLTDQCHYLGKQPKFVKGQLAFKEDSYVLVDPFSPRELRLANNFLLLGGACGQCGQVVCVDCSVFYARRYCNKCAEFYLAEFPKEIRGKIEKKQQSGRNGSGKKESTKDNESTKNR